MGAGWVVIAAWPLAFSGGCDDQTAAPAPPPQPTNDQATEQSPYRDVGGARVAKLPAIEDDQALAEAIAEAQASLDDARRQWADASAEQRQRWAIKWAAELVDGGIEHLWLRPTSWNAHRIEGVLLSQPTAELLSGRRRGEIVAITPGDVSDWVHFTSEDGDDYEGGFTIALIEENSRSSSDDR